MKSDQNRQHFTNSRNLEYKKQTKRYYLRHTEEGPEAEHEEQNMGLEEGQSEIKGGESGHGWRGG